MRTGQADSVLCYVRRLADTAGAASDRQLLDQFVRCRDEAAFEALLRRHGPMVLGVCRRILGNSHDAEDAFQATFLALAQKARSLGRAGSAAGWLYRVAYRAALRLRVLAASQRRHERSRPAAAGSDPLAEVSGRELLAVLDEELRRLPERQRLPLLLCYLQAHTCEEAARQLGLAPRTFKRRLQEARQCLRRRLERRGLQLSAALLAAGVTTGPMTPDLTAATLAAVARAGAASAARMSLFGGVSAGKLKVVAGLCLAVGVLAAGAGLYCQRWAAPGAPAAAKTETSTEAVRVDGQGDPLPEGALLRLGNVRFLHGGIVRAVAFSADGKLLATGADDHRIRLWEANSGKEVRRIGGRLDMIHALAFSPDGKRLASGGEDRLVHLWDVDTGNEAGRFVGHTKEVRALAFTADGARLASAGGDETVRLWDVAAGKEVGRCRANHGWGSPLRFFADGARLAVGADESVVVWDTKRPKGPERLLAAVDGIRDFALSPDGKTLATTREKDTLTLWDVASGKRRGEGKGMSGFERLVFSPDGALVVTGGFGALRWWDAATGRMVRESERMGDFPLAFSPDGKVLATTQWDHRLRLWDVKTGKQRHPWQGHTRNVVSVAFAPDGKSLATAGWDQSVRTWQLPTGKEQLCLRLPGRYACQSVRYHPDGTALGVIGLDGVLYLWGAADGKQQRRWRPDGTFALAQAFPPGGRPLVAGWRGKEIVLWDMARDKKLRSFPSPVEEGMGVVQLHLSPDGRYLACQGFSKDRQQPNGPLQNELVVWDCKSGAELRTFRCRQGIQRPLAFSADGRLLATEDGNGSLCVRELSGGAVVSRYAGDARLVYALAFSRDDHTLAAGHGNGPVSVWEAATGKEVCRFSGHSGSRVFSVAFSPDGRLLASGGEDANALVWDVPGRLRGPGPLPERLSEAERLRLGADLGDPDAARAYRAVALLAALPRDAVPLVQERLRSLRAEEERRKERIPRLLAGLDSDRFEERQKASAELEKMGRWAEPSLRKALAGDCSPEARRRIEALLKRLQPWSLPPDGLVILRSLQVLEQIGSPEAVRMLKGLAEQLDDGRLRREAHASCGRLGW